MKIGDWLLNHYKKRFDPDGTKGFKVIDHAHGPTWNDGGAWNRTIILLNGEFIEVFMPSDYNTDKLGTRKMKSVLKETWEPV